MLDKISIFSNFGETFSHSKNSTVSVITEIHKKRLWLENQNWSNKKKLKKKEAKGVSNTILKSVSAE